MIFQLKVISIDFSLAIALYIFIILIVILAAWLFYRKQKERHLGLDPKYIWFCSICSYTYINTKEEKISTCPRCGSYNKK
ncbi:MAG: hypothetical protein PHG40_02305 [Candidatus Omnitrophica bacterium]|nr:hypothetical protein [Candidatus Omnitrophota bacterium]